jgi:hypothetical protein
MATPHDQYYLDEDGQGRYATLGAIDRDLDRLGELTGAYVTDQKEDLSGGKQKHSSTASGPPSNPSWTRSMRRRVPDLAVTNGPHPV